MEIADIIQRGTDNLQKEAALRQDTVNSIQQGRQHKSELALDTRQQAEDERHNSVIEADAATGRELQASGQALQDRQVSIAERSVQMAEQKIIDKRANSILNFVGTLSDKVAEAENVTGTGNDLHIASAKRKRSEKIMMIMSDPAAMLTLSKSSLINEERGASFARFALETATPEEKARIMTQLQALADLEAASNPVKVAPEQQAFLNSRGSAMGRISGEYDMKNQLGITDEGVVSSSVSDIYAAGLSPEDRRIYEERKQSGITQEELEDSSELMFTFFQDIISGGLATQSAGKIDEAMQSLLNSDLFDIRNPNRTILADIYNTFEAEYSGRGSNKKAITKLKERLSTNFGLKLKPETTLTMPGEE